MQPLIGEPPHTPVSWQQKLDLACDEAEVLAIAREFLAMLTPYEIDKLPRPCQPPLKLVDRDDVASYAYDLVRHDCEDGPETAELVHKLAHFFSHATMRIAQVTSRTQLARAQRWPDAQSR